MSGAPPRVCADDTTGGARIGAVSIIVPDYDQGIAFYCDALGFLLTEDIDQGSKRWVTVQPPGGGPHLVLARAETTAQRHAIGNQGGGRVWLFLQTDDFHKDYADMRAKGILFEEPPRQEPYGTVAVFNDAFGNRWDLIEFGK